MKVTLSFILYVMASERILFRQLCVAKDLLFDLNVYFIELNDFFKRVTMSSPPRYLALNYYVTVFF